MEDRKEEEIIINVGDDIEITGKDFHEVGKVSELDKAILQMMFRKRGRE